MIEELLHKGWACLREGCDSSSADNACCGSLGVAHIQCSAFNTITIIQNSSNHDVLQIILIDDSQAYPSFTLGPWSPPNVAVHAVVTAGLTQSFRSSVFSSSKSISFFV